jgi:Ferritin-like
MPDILGKLLPRNLAALRVGQDPSKSAVLATGNPASTLLQSGVGNCFPGLEFDLRNLERRFFPFLEVDTNFVELHVVDVDIAGMQAATAEGTVSPATAAAYQNIANSLGVPGQRWKILRLAGDFGPLGVLDITVDQLTRSSIGAGRLPADAWTAIRLLKEGATVTITLRSPQGQSAQIAGPRRRYLDPTGALSAMFAVGELSQSLCSPWTHDFRDCGCYYWATNHPDIALPPVAPSDIALPASNLAAPWLRADRGAQPPPAADARNTAPEIRHNAINRTWQALNIVLERREWVTPYAEQLLIANPLPNQTALEAHLRFAAGVELAVMQEYLVAAWSLRLSAGVSEPLKGDLRAAFFELQQVAIGEMRHLRVVNEILRHLTGPAAFTPALQVATQVPLGAGQSRPVSFRALAPDVMTEFVQIEAPSQSVDSLYGRILATLEAFSAPADTIQGVRTIMAEGSEHWQTFLFVQEWLRRHDPADYLRATVPADPSSAAHQTLQTRYQSVLQALHRGYTQGLPLGASDVNTARMEMLGGNGIEGALEALAASGALPRFDPVTDPRFAPIPPPL